LCEEITGNELFSLDINDYYGYSLEYDVDYCFYIDAVNESGRSRSNEVCSQLAQPPKADILYPYSSKVFESGDGFDMLIDIENGPFISVLEVFEVGGPGSFNGGTTEEILIQSLDFSNSPLESGIFSCPVGAGLQTRHNEQVSDNIDIKIVLTDIAGNTHDVFSAISVRTILISILSLTCSLCLVCRPAPTGQLNIPDSSGLLEKSSDWIRISSVVPPLNDPGPPTSKTSRTLIKGPFSMSMSISKPSPDSKTFEL
jgi:hypothetical protein